MNMDDKSCGNCSMKHHILYQQDCDSNHCDVSIGYGFKTATLSTNVNIQVPFKDTAKDDEKGNGDVSSGYGF